jgi:hypothetical protein
MVDTQKLVDRPAARPIQIFRGCNPRVASAIKRFSERWGRYSVRSRRYPIYVLLAETVDGAWRDYIDSLPVDYLGRVHREDQFLSIIAERDGFDSFDKQFTRVMSSIDSERKLKGWIESKDVRLPLSGDINLRQLDREFRATISTLQELAFRCKGKKPKKIQVGKLNARRLRPHCELCGEPTELAAILKGAEWPVQDPNQRASLSGRYCANHRPKHHDQTWNPSYQRAKRSKEAFVREVFKIEHHTCDVPDISVASDKGIGDPFLWDLAHQLNSDLLEDGRIRNLARELVDTRISIRKRQVIMLLAAGESQSEIARRLGVSRQAISKTVKSEPFRRAFMMNRPDASPNHPPEHHTTH